MSRSKNAERLEKYRKTMEAQGFRRISFYGCAELDALLRKERQPNECTGRTLERLLLGKAAPRPGYWTPEEIAERIRKMARMGQRQGGV